MRTVREGGVGKVTGLRRGSHETTVQGQNQEGEGDLSKSGGSGGGSQDKVGPSRNMPLLGRLPERGKGMSETSLTRSNGKLQREARIEEKIEGDPPVEVASKG